LIPAGLSSSATSILSDQDPLHFIESELVVAAVIKAGGTGTFVVRHLLGDFELAFVLIVLK
jgi:hypothetical protein